MAPVIYEWDGKTPLPPDAVDGMTEFLDPENDIGPTWDAEVDDFPSYLKLGNPSKADRASALHAILDEHGGPEGMADYLGTLEDDKRTALIGGLARLGGVTPEHIEHHVIGDPASASDYLAQLDAHHEARGKAEQGDDVHHDVRVAELKADLMEAILEDPSSPDVDDLTVRLAHKLRHTRK